MPTIKDVRNFWENYPLFAGESKFEIGSKEFFEEYRKVCIEDCFAGDFFKQELFIPRILPKNAKILDLGCGNSLGPFPLNCQNFCIVFYQINSAL